MRGLSVLCVCPGSNYYRIPGLDLWNEKRDAFNFVGDNKVITHAPCAQWSKMRAFAKVNEREKALAGFCLDVVERNGGIFEHPAGSSLFDHFGVKPTASVDQSWFGFGARKTTWLYCKKVRLLSIPLFLHTPATTVERMGRSSRSKMTLEFCQWLVDSVIDSMIYSDGLP